jgi:hypothetical protein
MSGRRKHGGFIERAGNSTRTVRHGDQIFIAETAALPSVRYVELRS